MKKALLASLTVFLISNLIALPWGIRNYRIWHTYLPYGYSQSRDLYGCLNTSVKDVRISTQTPGPGQPDHVEAYDEALHQNNVKEIDRIAKQEVRKYLIRHPIHFLINGFKKEYYFLRPELDRKIFPVFMKANLNDVQPALIVVPSNLNPKPVWPIDLIMESTKNTPGFSWFSWANYFERAAQIIFYFFIFIGTIGGLVSVWWTWPTHSKNAQHGLIIIGLCAFFWIAEMFLIYPETKYRFPIEPFMMMLTAFWIRSFCFD